MPILDLPWHRRSISYGVMQGPRFPLQGTLFLAPTVGWNSELRSPAPSRSSIFAVKTANDRVGDGWVVPPPAVSKCDAEPDFNPVFTSLHQGRVTR